MSDYDFFYWAMPFRGQFVRAVQDGGKQMWTQKRWQEFTPRLKKWMSLWEETGRRHGLAAESGFLLGGDEPGIADVVTATLWTTMADRFGRVDAVLREAGPMTYALSRRVATLEPLARLAATSREAYGDAYCGGEIGESMKKVLND